MAVCTSLIKKERGNSECKENCPIRQQQFLFFSSYKMKETGS